MRLRLFRRTRGRAFQGAVDRAHCSTSDGPLVAQRAILGQSPELLVLSVKHFQRTVPQLAALRGTSPKFVRASITMNPRFTIF